MLVLQSITGAFALGGSGSPQLDAFGNPLRLAGSIAFQDGDHGGGQHGELPNCCLLGCGVAASPLGAPPDSTTLVVQRPIEFAAMVRAPSRIRISARDYEPGNPRAPPLKA